MKHLPFYFCASTIIFCGSLKAQQPQFTVHEWGTFTSLYGSDGQQLSDIYREEELLPGFVHKLNNIVPALTPEKHPPQLRLTEGGYYYETTELQNVNVKMETPVIYFYSKDSFTAQVKVTFKNGLIGQWYPQCINIPEISYREEAKLPGPSTNNVLPGSNGNISIVPENLVFDLSPKVDFAKATNMAEWKIKVNGPLELDASSVIKNNETNTWTAPRETDANIISYGKEHEKYIFYRGLGNFEMPVKVSFDINGSLKIQNEGPDKIPYLFVYERKDDGKAIVYWTGALETGEKHLVHVDINTEGSFNEKITEFQQQLVSAGLFDKEAAAMLNTWKQSYFSHTGLRVFWIAPRAFTDNVIPLSINPAPENLVRVLVGRSEILKPSFEKDLLENTDFRNSYKKDRFFLAMEQRVNDLKSNPAASDTVNLKIANEVATNLDYEKLLRTESIAVYPNPASKDYTIAIAHPQSNHANILFTDMAGHTLISYLNEKLANQEVYSRDVDISFLPKGIYVLQVQTGSQNFVQKVVKE